MRVSLRRKTRARGSTQLTSCKLLQLQENIRKAGEGVAHNALLDEALVTMLIMLTRFDALYAMPL